MAGKCVQKNIPTFIPMILQRSYVKNRITIFQNWNKRKTVFFYEFGSLEAAMRQLDIMWEIKNYLEKHPKATIVNLGCGFDEMGKACDNGNCNIVNIDFPDIIDVRNQLIMSREREINIPCDIKDYSWMNEVDGSDGVIFIAAGVFHYFGQNEVKELAFKLSEKYSGGCLVLTLSESLV